MPEYEEIAPAGDAPAPNDAGGGDPNDHLQNLYNVLHQNGSYTKSYDDFQKQFSTTDKIDKLYGVLNSSSRYTKSKDEFYSQFFPSYKASNQKIGQPDYSSVPRPVASGETETTPLEKIRTATGANFNTDPATIANQNRYRNLKATAFQEVESPAWKDKLFVGKIPALTEDPNIPLEAYQHIDKDKLDDYLATKDLNTTDRYWLRNQLINYSNQRQQQYFIQQRAIKKADDLPELTQIKNDIHQQVEQGVLKPEDADKVLESRIRDTPGLANLLNQTYASAAKEQEASRQAAVANLLNNIGLTNKPLSQNAPFHDQITGLNKALMGTINFTGDLGQQVSSLLELGHLPGISRLGYELKTIADDSKAKNEIPQNGELGNTLSGQVVPMALSMIALQRGASALGKPLYQALGAAKSSGMMSEFAQGMVGGIAISPINSYVMAQQYYNEQVKQGEEPSKAASKADQVLTKNMATDIFMTPLQLGLLKMPAGKWYQKALTMGAESATSGLHFTLQDFNVKDTENPALHIIDYLKDDPEAAKTFFIGAALGGLQKAAVDGIHNWKVNTETNNLFNYNRQYGGSQQKSLPSNESIANNVLGAIEMKDTPGRPAELKQLINSFVEQGVYSTEEGNRVNKIIDDVSAARQQVPKYGHPLQRLAVFNELLKQRVMDEHVANAGNEAVTKGIEEERKLSNERIQRIMEGKEPLYFVNGNETTKEELLEQIGKHPELLSEPGARIDIRNDPETAKHIADLKNKSNAIQKQITNADVVRNSPADGEAVGKRNEGKGTIDEEATREKGPVQATDQYLRSRHADVAYDEEGKVSGQMDAGLSEKGKEQRKELAEEVAQHYDIKKVITPDSPRGKETGEEIAKTTGAKQEVRANLRSWDIGDFDGIKEKDWTPIHRYFVEHPNEKTYEGRSLGESFNEYKQRMIDSHEELEGEPASTFVVDHSNNMNLWDAYKAAGKDWTNEAAEDYLTRKSPEPATIQEHEDVNVAAEVENGRISDDTLLNAFKQAIDETTGALQRIREGHPAEAGSGEAHGALGSEPTPTSDQESVPAPEPGTETAKQDTGTESVSPGAGSADAARVTEQAGVPDLYSREFIKEDVKPALAKLGAKLKDGLDILRKAYDPRAGVSERALTHIMRALGDRNQLQAIVDAGLKSVERMFDKMPDADRIAFIDRIKRGQAQPTPELTQIANLIRGLDDALYDEIKKYKPSFQWKEDHFRVLWKTIPGTTKQRLWSAQSRRPLEGSKGFMKKATLVDMTEGITKGGEPQSTNPITMFKLAYADGMKFITAQRMFEALKKNKFAQFVRSGKEPPTGFVRLDDRIANVYFNSGSGPVKTGEYWVDEGTGRLLNNYLSKDWIRSKEFGRGLMALKNAYTAAELGFSGFHAVAEGLEAISSQVGIGLRRMFNLGLARRDLSQVARGIKDIVTSPTAFATTASTGAKAMKFATEESWRNSKAGQDFLKTFPPARDYVDDFFRGGGLIRQHEDLRSNISKMIKEQAGKDNYIGATLRAVPALHEMVFSPLFNIYIPRLKTGMFFKEFPVRLEENKVRLAKGTITREQLARETVDFIDDRLGEMNFDNLFWNKTFKTVHQFFLRSVTWKLGNLRAMGGVIPEQARELYNAGKEGRRPVLMPKAAWLLGLSAMQVTLATIIQHMLAGKGIQDGTDIVAPQIDANDENQRVIMPTYYKDMLHIYHSPGGYLGSGLAGQISRVADLWSNKDFYNYEIYDPHENPALKAKDMLLYIAPKPFSITSAMAMKEKGEPFTKQAMSFMGLVKAPGYLTHTDIENKIFDLYNLRNAGTKPFAERESNKAKADIRDLYRKGDATEAQAKLRESIKDGLIRPSQVRSLLQRASHVSNPSAFFFKELPYEDKAYLFEQMTDTEKKIYDPTGNLRRQIQAAKATQR